MNDSSYWWLMSQSRVTLTDDSRRVTWQSASASVTTVGDGMTASQLAEPAACSPHWDVLMHTQILHCLPTLQCHLICYLVLYVVTWLLLNTSSNPALLPSWTEVCLCCYCLVDLNRYARRRRLSSVIHNSLQMKTAQTIVLKTLAFTLSPNSSFLSAEKYR